MGVNDMKKLFLTMTAGAAVFSLAACGETDTEQAVTSTGGEELSAEDVLSKTIERQQAMESVSATMETTQNMHVEADGETQEVKTTMNGTIDTIIEPLALAMDTTMNMQMGEETVDMPMKMYLNAEQGFFYQDPTSNTWLKLPQEQADAIFESANMANVDQTQQLEQLKEFTNDLTVEEDGDNYVLKLTIEGEKFNALVREQMESMMNSTTGGEPLTEEELQAAVDAVDITSGDYEYVVNQETFDIEDVLVNLNMTMDMEGQPMTVETTTNMTFTDYNHLDTIDIPQEVIDTAVDATQQ